MRFIEAKTASDIVDPDTTLGIEITDRDVATRCGLGNLDGQHVRRDDWMAGLAAIEIAMRVDLDACLAGHPGPPRPGSNLPTIVRGTTTLATTRPDVDSDGAMAVLVLRTIGIAIDVEFVKVVANADSFRVDAWSPKPLPTEENPWPSGTTTVDSTRSLAALGMICSPRPHDRTRSLSLVQRVYLMAIRLATIEGLREFGRTAPHVDEYNQLSDSSRGEIRLAETLGIHPLIDGQTAVKYIGDVHNDAHKARQALARAAHEPGALIGRSKFVEVRVAHAGALSLGYCLAPVVCAFDQGTKGKVTIAAYTDGHLDVAGLTAELNRLEAEAGGTPKWGGPRNMVCSPSHVGTRLAEAVISATVARFGVRK